MRRTTEFKVAEKRALFSTGKKNSLKRIYKKINMEEKSFMSTSQLDRRMLLSRHEKLRHIWTDNSTQQRTQNSALNVSRSCLPQIHRSNAGSRPSLKTSPKNLESRKDSKSAAHRLDSDFKHEPVKDKVGTLSGSGDDLISERTVNTSPEILWKRYLEEQRKTAKLKTSSKMFLSVDDDAGSAVKSPSDILAESVRSHNPDSATKKLRKRQTGVRMNEKPESVAYSPEKPKSKRGRNPRLSVTFDEPPLQRVSGQPDERDDPTMDGSQDKGNLASKTSKRPATPGLLPALGIIRRGSICDVKTFTSGRVLDLLSTGKDDSGEKKSKTYLEVECEELKYCRYLRSVTPSSGQEGEDISPEIPEKYRPSKNIIVGHTKVASLL